MYLRRHSGRCLGEEGEDINEQLVPLAGEIVQLSGETFSINAWNYIYAETGRMKIIEGQNAKDLPVQVSGAEDDFVINVSTMEQLEIYPPFEVLGQTSLVQLDPQIGKKYILKNSNHRGH